MNWTTVVRCVGGIYEVGPFCLMIHDHGVFTAWRQIITWEWRRPDPHDNPRGRR